MKHAAPIIVVMLLALYVGAYVGTTCHQQYPGMTVRVVRSSIAKWVFWPAARAEAAWRGEPVVLVQFVENGPTDVESVPLW